LESRLQESPYLAGSKYTIADIASFSWVRGAPITLEIELSEFPALKKWVEEIDQRAAVQKGVDVPHLGKTQEEKVEMFRNFRAKIDAMTNTDKH
jgi:glutathione S-transferase